MEFASALELARRKYPGVKLAPEQFERRLAENPSASDVADLYLAEACLEGDPAGLQAFEQLLSNLRDVAARASPVSFDEVLQVVRVRLLVKQDGGRRLADYEGRGTLASWLKTVVIHTAVSLGRRERTGEHVDSLVMLELPDEREWPEMSLARHVARTRMRDALERALARLTRQQRVLLRQHYLDDLTLEELAAYSRVHRATIARWMAAAREALLAALEEEAGDLEELWGLVQSRLTLSVSRLLAESD
jgi:RNA polymerase sigma-70 factor, ECF subfamily